MDIKPDCQYLFTRDGQQYGPFDGAQILQLAEKRQILHSDTVWTEGLDGWLPASTFNQLAPIFIKLAGQGPPVASKEPLPISKSTPMPVSPISAAMQQKQPDNDIDDAEVSPMAQVLSGSNQVQPVITGAGYTGQRKGAKFSLVLLTLFPIVLGIAALALIMIQPVMLGLNSAADTSTVDGSGWPIMELLVDKPYIVYGIAGLILLGFFLNGILNLVYLHRAWNYIQDVPNVTTTPGKAVGLLFLPVFNLVWMFFAYYRWSSDYNMRCDIDDPTSSDRVSEGLFLFHCIFAVIGLPILYIFMMYQMCRGINYLTTEEELIMDPNSGYHL